MKRRTPSDGLVKKPLKILVEDKPSVITIPVISKSEEESKDFVEKPAVIVIPNENSRIENIKKEAIEKLIQSKNMLSLKASENPLDFHNEDKQSLNITERLELKPKKHKKKKVVYVSESEDSNEE